MAKHEITIHANTGTMKELAPNLGSYVPKETSRLDESTVAVSALCGLPAIQVLAILSGSFHAIQELEKEALVRVHLDGFTVEGVITGSFPSADAAFDPERNKLLLALRLDDDVKNELAGVVPTIVTDDDITKLRVDNLMDLAENKPYNVVHGQGVFRVSGHCMVLTDPNAEVFVQGEDKTRYEVVVDAIQSKQLFTAHTAEPLEPGDYKLVVKSRAGVQEGPLQTAFKRVKVLKAATPPGPLLESVSSESGKGCVQTAGAFTVIGKGLAKLDGDTLVFHHLYTTDDGQELSSDYDLEEWSSTDTTLSAICPSLMRYNEDRARIALKRDGKEYTIDCDIEFV